MTASHLVRRKRAGEVRQDIVLNGAQARRMHTSGTVRFRYAPGRLQQAGKVEQVPFGKMLGLRRKLRPIEQQTGIIPEQPGSRPLAISNTCATADGTTHMGPAAQRLKRVFEFDITLCPHCGGRLRGIADVTDPVVIRKILDHVHQRAPPEQHSTPETYAISSARG